MQPVACYYATFINHVRFPPCFLFAISTKNYGVHTDLLLIKRVSCQAQQTSPRAPLHGANITSLNN